MATPPARRAAQNAVFFKRLNKRQYVEKVRFVIYLCGDGYYGREENFVFKEDFYFYPSLYENSVIVGLVFDTPNEISVKLKNIIMKGARTFFAMQAVFDRVVINRDGAGERFRKAQAALWNADNETWDGFFTALKLEAII